MAQSSIPLADVVIGRRFTHGAARRLREQAGISQRELARYVGCDVAQINRWERGLARPRPAAAARWAEALDELRVALARTLMDAEP